MLRYADSILDSCSQNLVWFQVVGAMAVVRNSVGSNCYVSDEIITSRAGVRIRVGNTDAEVG